MTVFIIERLTEYTWIAYSYHICTHSNNSSNIAFNVSHSTLYTHYMLYHVCLHMFGIERRIDMLSILYYNISNEWWRRKWAQILLRVIIILDTLKHLPSKPEYLLCNSMCTKYTLHSYAFACVRVYVITKIWCRTYGTNIIFAPPPSSKNFSNNSAN